MFYIHGHMVLFSEHAQDALLVYAHAYWVGGSEHVPNGCFVYMAINSKFWGAKKDSVPNMVMIILTNIPVECGIVDSLCR